MSCERSPYVLPTIDFVGGETQKLAFHLFHHTNRRPFDASDCRCDFSVVNYLNRTGEPVLSKTMETDGEGGNTLTVKLLPSDTVGLSGKYIYQISVADSSGDTEIPKQGLLYITNNINKTFIG